MQSLNEHIDRMKQLFQAQHGIIRPLISEQDDVTQPGQFKDKINKEILFDESYLDSFPIDNKKKETYKKMNPNFDKQLSELKQHPAYKPLIEKIKDNGDAMTIFYFQLIQSSRIAFLNKTLDFLRSFTKKRKLQKRVEDDPNYTGEDELYNWEADIVKGDETKTIVPIETKNNVNYQTFNVPLQVGGKTVYVDNSTEPDVSLIDAINKWINDAKMVIDEAKTVNPNVSVELSKIDIASSCSRLRNTGNYEGQTWAKLSADRAERVYGIIVNELQNIGVTVSPSIEKVIRGGYNGDGSSGPDPSKKFLFDNGKSTNGMGYSTDGSDKLSGPDSQRKVQIGSYNYGQLLSTQEESHQYKFCIVIATIIISSKNEGVKPLQPDAIYTKGYSLKLEPKYYKKLPKKIKKFKGAYKGQSKLAKFFERDAIFAYQKMEKCPIMY